jgi:hypothetical protein
MVPSESLELKLFQFAELAGKAMWRAAGLGTLSNALQFVETGVLVDALGDLHARGFLELRQWSYEEGTWLVFDGSNREYFDYEFQMRVTFSGRKYFERLEAQAKEELVPVPTGHAVPVLPLLKARLDSSPQKIALPPMEPPTAFVSHSGKDRQFVDRFVQSLWDAGVIAWYSKWEIKPGDPIPAKIDKGLEESEFFIIVLSRNSIDATWVQTELQSALARMMSGKVKKIIPMICFVESLLQKERSANISRSR